MSSLRKCSQKVHTFSCLRILKSPFTISKWDTVLYTLKSRFSEKFLKNTLHLFELRREKVRVFLQKIYIFLFITFLYRADRFYSCGEKTVKHLARDTLKPRLKFTPSLIWTSGIKMHTLFLICKTFFHLPPRLFELGEPFFFPSSEEKKFQKYKKSLNSLNWEENTIGKSCNCKVSSISKITAIQFPEFENLLILGNKCGIITIRGDFVSQVPK